jgi:YHS domain-containing protein/thiol-disulfide isomerase/thioredoxin
MSAHFSRSFAGIFVAASILLCRSSVAAEIPWSTDIEDSLRRAAGENQLVLMEFTADWCVFCKKMEKTTFKDPKVIQSISRGFVAVRVDADQNKGLVKDLGIKGLPAILVVSPDLQVVERISGFQTPEALIPKLDAITAARVNRSRSSAVASSQRPVRRPLNPASPQNSFEQERIGPGRPAGPAPGELQFEAITQEEAPRVGMRRAPTPPENPFFEEPVVRQSQSAMTQSSGSDSDEFFRTISRRQETRSAAAAESGPSFDGLCIVSAVDGRELVKGSAGNQLKYKGRTLYFSSIESKERFQASPAAYWPMLDGACAMSLLQDEQQVEGSLEFAAVFRKRIWLFANQAAMQEFLLDPADVAQNATELAAELQR